MWILNGLMYMEDGWTEMWILNELNYAKPDLHGACKRSVDWGMQWLCGLRQAEAARYCTII